MRPAQRITQVTPRTPNTNALACAPYLTSMQPPSCTRPSTPRVCLPHHHWQYRLFLCEMLKHAPRGSDTATLETAIEHVTAGTSMDGIVAISANYCPMHSLTHLLTHSLTHSLTHQWLNTATNTSSDNARTRYPGVRRYCWRVFECEGVSAWCSME